MSEIKLADPRQAFAAALLEAAKKDRNIILLTTDSRGSACMSDFARELPAQYVEMGIAEQDSVGVAAGLGLSGKNAFACGPAVFLSLRSGEQVKVDVAYSHSNVKLVGVSAGVSYGSLGSTHHSAQDLAVMTSLPDMLVLVPSDSLQAAAMANYLSTYSGPAYIRMGRGKVPCIYKNEADAFTPGKGNLLREGTDITIVTAGEPVSRVLDAAEMLEKRGISCAVIDMCQIKPIDAELLISRKYAPVVTVEEHSPAGGLGDAVSRVLSPFGVRQLRLSLPDDWAICAESKALTQSYGLDAEGIAGSVMQFLGN